MSSTYHCIYHHLIFATKNREPCLPAEVRGELFDYLGGVVRGMGATPMRVGGVADHVHLLISLKPTHCIADFMRELKKTSCLWIQGHFHQPNFQWQEGYAVFSVSASSVKSVQVYIDNQAEHHRHKTFREELTQFLKKTGVKFDERYLE